MTKLSIAEVGGKLSAAVLLLACHGCVQEAPIGTAYLSPMGPANFQSGAVVASVIRAAAPPGFGAAFLGVPLDASFNPLVGGGAGPMFMGGPQCSPTSLWTSERRLIQNNQERKANLRAWVFFNASLGSQQEHMYGYERAMQLTYTCHIPPGTPMGQAPLGAAYFASAIFFGHSYTVVVHGDNRAFNAGVGAQFQSWGGSASSFARDRNLSVMAFGRGLQPVGPDALFADPRNVQANFMALPEAPDAVIVEYTQIPNAVVEAPVPERVVEVRFSRLEVGSTGSWLYSYSNWHMSAQCYVNDAAEQGPEDFVERRVTTGPTVVTFAHQIRAHDGDTIECRVDGTYTRADAPHNLGSASTGPIRVPEGASSTGILSGDDAHTSYRIMWSAQRLQ